MKACWREPAPEKQPSNFAPLCEIEPLAGIDTVGRRSIQEPRKRLLAAANIVTAALETGRIAHHLWRRWIASEGFGTRVRWTDQEIECRRSRIAQPRAGLTRTTLSRDEADTVAARPVLHARRCLRLGLRLIFARCFQRFFPAAPPSDSNACNRSQTPSPR
jgi:hypothetical protein